MITVNLYYKGKNGSARAFAEEMEASGIADSIRAEEGNLRYQYFIPMNDPERPPSNSHGDWTFLRPPERVPEVPVVSREHLPQLENIQEVLASRRDEAHFR